MGASLLALAKSIYYRISSNKKRKREKRPGDEVGVNLMSRNNKKSVGVVLSLVGLYNLVSVIPV